MVSYTLRGPILDFAIGWGIAVLGAVLLLRFDIVLLMLLGSSIPLGLLLAYVYFGTKRNFKSREARRAFEDWRTFGFSDEDIYTETGGGAESKLPWSYITKITPYKGYSLFFIGKALQLVVPDSAFTSPEEFQAFRDLAVSKVPIRAKRKWSRI
jgi:hypothetical protein